MSGQQAPDGCQEVADAQLLGWYKQEFRQGMHAEGNMRSSRHTTSAAIQCKYNTQRESEEKREGETVQQKRRRDKIERGRE
jgi:hypothetical protein